MSEEQIDDAIATMTVTDMIRSLLAIQTADMKLVNLTDTMKQSLIDGANKVRNAISVRAYHYYEDNDFEPTPVTIPLMRTVVEGFAASGGKL